MRLTAWEEDRLLVFTAAELARGRRGRGIVLNAPEAIALICDAMFEAARAGAAYDDVVEAGRTAVDPKHVLDGVRELVDEVRLEVLLGDGTRLIVLADPLGRGRPVDARGPGAVVIATAPPSTREGRSDSDRSRRRERRSIIVRNDSRRVVRVSSHHPFDRVNPRLRFDRSRTAGFRLDLPAGDSERWAPGEVKTVGLVRYGGEAGVDADDPGSAVPPSGS
jgi:urease subunit gamma/beta